MWPLAACLIDTKTPLSLLKTSSVFEVSELQPSCCISLPAPNSSSGIRKVTLTTWAKWFIKQTTCPPLYFLHVLLHSLYYLIPTLLVWEVKKKTKPNIRHCQLACELSPQSESCSPIASPHDLFHNSTVSHWPSVWGPGLLPTWDREGPATQLPWRSKSPFLWDLNLHSKAGITIDVNCITWMQAGLF